MKPAQRPAKGWPWEAPNYTFSIPGWPPRFEPQGGAAGLAKASQAAAAATRSRATALAAGATGSIHGGLSKASAHVVGDVRKAVVKRGRA